MCVRSKSAAFHIVDGCVHFITHLYQYIGSLHMIYACGAMCDRYLVAPWRTEAAGGVRFYEG